MLLLSRMDFLNGCLHQNGHVNDECMYMLLFVQQRFIKAGVKNINS